MTPGRLAWRLLPLAVTLAALLLAWELADGEAVVRRLGDLDPAWLGLGLLISLPQLALSAARWRLTARRLGLPLGYGRALREYWLATFLNQAMPGGVGGDLLRAWRHRQQEGAPAAGGNVRMMPALRAVAVERLAGYLALMPCAAAGALIWLPMPLGPIVAIGSLLVLAFIMVGPRLLRRLPRVPGLGILMEDIDRALLARGVLPLQILLSGAILATYLLVFACAAAAVGAPLDALFLVTGVPIILLSMALPLSVGGWGLREATSAGLWALTGAGVAAVGASGIGAAGAEAGLAASVAYGITVLLASLPGALVLLFSR